MWTFEFYQLIGTRLFDACKRWKHSGFIHLAKGIVLICIRLAGTFAACLSLRNVRSKLDSLEGRPRCRSRQLCKARRKRVAEEEAEDDDDDAGFQSSRGSNDVDDDELGEDDAEEVEGASQAVAEEDDDEEDGKVPKEL